MTARRSLAALALACALSLTAVSTTGCSHASTTETQPNSPQTTVAQLNKTVADTNLEAVKTVIALRNAGKISQANTTTIENWLGFVATTNKSIGLILVKAEPWSQQKAEILTLLGTVTAPALAANIDPGAQAIVAQIMTLIAQIKVQVTQ